jgi:hypothetical protein
MPHLCVVPSLAFPQIGGYGSELLKGCLQVVGYGVRVFEIG